MITIHWGSRLLLAVALCLTTDALCAKRPSTASAGEHTDEVQLIVGEQRVFNAANVDSFSESTRGVIEVKIPRDGRKMVVTAARAGTTSLLLIMKNGVQKTLLFTVYSHRPEAIITELEQLTTEQPGLSLRQIGQRIFIDGVVATKAARARVEQVAELYSGQVSSLVQTDPDLVRPRTNIRLDLTFVERRARRAYGVGISWPAEVGGSHTVSGSLDLLTGTPAASYEVVDQSLPSLKAAEIDGYVKIRKQATLVTTSGNLATYLSGGEVNVAVSGSQAAELRTVPYGCKLSVLPRLSTGANVLDLKVDAEVAELAETGQDVPGRTLSRIETLVHLGLGQSILLSGLDAQSESDGTSGLPLLSRIPILGFFFGTINHRREQTDGVILITPTVLENLDREGKRVLEEALSEFESFDGDFE